MAMLKKVCLLQLIVCLCVALFAITACSKKVTPAVKGNGTGSFSVQDSKIIDPAGNEFIAQGINVNGPYWPWTRPTLPDVSLITDVWKFNTVRVDCWPEFNIYNNNNPDLDDIVSAFTAKKVVAIIEDHNFIGRYPNAAELDTLTKWWVNIANKYKSDPYVWFNIMNEPGASGAVPVDWLNTHEAVIKAIRATGADNIIVCDDHAYGQANGYANDAGSGVITYGATISAKYQNIIFSIHTYDEWTYADERLKSYINAVHAKKLALIIGEYGTGDDISAEVATSVFKDAIALKVGRIGWQWCGVDIHKLTTTDGGFAINEKSGAKPTNLSFAGNLIWDDNHTDINLAGAEIAPPQVIVYNTGFEQGSPVSGAGISNGWINFGTTVYDNTSQNVKGGVFSAKVQSGAVGGFGQNIYLQPGGTYKLTAWGKNSTLPSLASNIGINYQSTFTGTQTTITALNFTQNGAAEKSVTFTVPANVASLY